MLSSKLIARVMPLIWSQERNDDISYEHAIYQDFQDLLETRRFLKLEGSLIRHVSGNVEQDDHDEDIPYLPEEPPGVDKIPRDVLGLLLQ